MECIWISKLLCALLTRRPRGLSCRLPSIRNSTTFLKCLLVPREMNTRFRRKTRWTRCWFPAPTYFLHIKLFKFGQIISLNISHMKTRTDLNLEQGLCIFTSYYFPDSSSYVVALKTSIIIATSIYVETVKICKRELDVLVGLVNYMFL